MSERHLFIADAHLRREDPAGLNAFARFLDETAAPGVRLYLLGDTFDVWIGRGQLSAEPELLPAVEAMARFVASGGELFYFHGNRDYYMDEYLTRRFGARSVSESLGIELDGARIHLTHGDELCANDRIYQFARMLIRGRVIRPLLLSLPLKLRYKLAAAYRNISRRGNAARYEKRHGVHPAALRRLSRRGFQVVLCGHVHRYADRAYRWDGQDLRLITLPCWSDCGWAMEYAGGRFALRRIDFT